jgi:O-antigen ligase
VPAVVAGLAGGVGAVLAAPLGPIAGVGLAAVLLVVIAWLRGLLTPLRFVLGGALLLVVAAVAFEIRSPDIEHFQEFVQEDPAPAVTRENVQTYAQRTILVYVGARIFLDHPLVGVGWQGSTEPYHALPYIDDARRRFPNQPEFSLPTEEHPWGVQNAYVQAAADMGLIGVLALLSAIVAGVVVGFSAARSPRAGDLAGAVAICWLLVAGVELAAYGLYAGVPINALLWLGLGLAAAAAASSGPPPTLRFRA